MTTESYNMPSRAVGYRRISRERDDNGLGLAAQAEAIKAEAKRLGLPLLTTFTDSGVSGGAAPSKRPALLDALAQLKTGDVLVIARRDRLARDLMIAGWIEKEAKRRGATIVSAAGEANGDTTDPYATALRQIIDVFAELERGVIRSRTTAALAVKRAAGDRWCGDAPYGFRWDAQGKLATSAPEQKTIKLILELRQKGATIRGIVAELKRRRRFSRKVFDKNGNSPFFDKKGRLRGGNRPFVLAQVQRILRRRQESLT